VGIEPTTEGLRRGTNPWESSTYVGIVRKLPHSSSVSSDWSGWCGFSMWDDTCDLETSKELAANQMAPSVQTNREKITNSDSRPL